MRNTFFIGNSDWFIGACIAFIYYIIFYILFHNFAEALQNFNFKSNACNAEWPTEKRSPCCHEMFKFKSWWCHSRLRPCTKRTKMAALTGYSVLWHEFITISISYCYITQPYWARCTCAFIAVQMCYFKTVHLNCYFLICVYPWKLCMSTVVYLECIWYLLSIPTHTHTHGKRVNIQVIICAMCFVWNVHRKRKSFRFRGCTLHGMAGMLRKMHHCFEIGPYTPVCGSIPKTSKHFQKLELN